VRRAAEVEVHSCGFDNAPGIKFCGECGRSLAPDKCRPPTSDPRAYTPRHLAEKILQSKLALEGERKQVTVLFADVKGSMELAERVDPEEWHRIMDRFFAILSEGVHRFEGTINQYTGDGIMALFGAHRLFVEIGATGHAARIGKELGLVNCSDSWPPP
jgi:class 3 adenylate cyclase